MLEKDESIMIFSVAIMVSHLPSTTLAISNTNPASAQCVSDLLNEAEEDPDFYINACYLDHGVCALRSILENKLHWQFTQHFGKHAVHAIGDLSAKRNHWNIVCVPAVCDQFLRVKESSTKLQRVDM